MFSCDEHFAGLNPSQGSELCTVVEYHVFARAVARHHWAIPHSATASNAWPSTRCPAHSPTTCGHTNTTRSRTRWSAACTTSPGPPTAPNPTSSASSRISAAAPRTSIRVGPSSPPACGWPAADDGIAASVYAPCEVHTTVRSTPIHITEETDYPFRDTVRISMHPDAACPSRCNCASPRGQRTRASASTDQTQPARNRAHSQASTAHGKRATPSKSPSRSKPRASHWFNDSIAFERGPLVFSYPHRRRLGKAARPRHDRRLAGLPHHAMELRSKHELHQNNRSADSRRPIQPQRHAGKARGQSPQAPRMGSRRRSSQSRPAKPRRKRPARRKSNAGSLRSRQTPYHGISRTKKLTSQEPRVPHPWRSKGWESTNPTPKEL